MPFPAVEIIPSRVPLWVDSWFHEQAKNNSDQAFALLHNFHKAILTVSLVAIFGAVAGSHGFQF